MQQGYLGFLESPLFCQSETQIHMASREIGCDYGDTAVEIFRFAKLAAIPVEIAQAEEIPIIVGLRFHSAAIGGNGFVGSIGLIECPREPPPSLRIVWIELGSAGESAERRFVGAMTFLELTRDQQDRYGVCVDSLRL